MGGIDQKTISDNANNEAWALHTTAASDRANAAIYANRASAESPGLNAATSLLSSAKPVADSWYKWSNATGGGSPSTPMPTATGDW